MASDPPPAYSTLVASTANLATAEDGAPNCEDGTEIMTNNSFEDKSTRIGFIQKVLATKLLQLFLVAMVFGIFQAYRPQVEWFMDTGSNRENLIVVSIMASIITLWLLVKVLCSDQNRQQNAIRYVFLVVYPLNLAFMVTFLTLFWDFLAPVLVAWFTYCGAVFALLMYSIFAMQTKLEFTAKNGFVLAIFVQFILYVIIVSFVYVNGFYTIYVTLALGVVTAYVVWDLEIMTSKSYWARITPSDYLDGVLYLHIDYYYIMCKFIYRKILESVNTEESS